MSQHERCSCVNQVWIDAVVASKDAALRERDIVNRENTVMRALLQRLREWDHMQTAGDGHNWLVEIAKALNGKG